MSLPAAIARVRPSVVQLRVAGNRQVLGTGFFADEDGHVVTAKHVIDEGRRTAGAEDVSFTVGLALANTDQIGGLSIAVRGSFTLLFAEVVREDAGNDLAILHCVENPFRNGLPPLIAVNETEVRSELGRATLNVERPADGIAVASSGYPLSNSVLITNTGVIASAWATAADTHDLGLGIATSEPTDRYIADLEVNPGNSGGPVYLVEDGSVTGVCVATQAVPVTRGGAPVVMDGMPLVSSSGLTIVIPTRYVVELLAGV